MRALLRWWVATLVAAVTVVAPWAAPPYVLRRATLVQGNAILIVGDTHFESQLANYPQGWRETMAADLVEVERRTNPLAWVQAGDQTTDNNPTDRAAFAAWWDRITPAGVPQVVAAGNHDVPVTPWPEPMFVDVGHDLRVITVPPVSGDQAPEISAESLGWLDARIGETDRSVVVVFHAPLRDTVNAGNADPAALSSSDDPWYAKNADAIAQMLGRHENVVAWVSGHTHSPIGTPGLVSTVDYGGGPFAAVSASSPVSIPPGAPVVSCLVTVYERVVVVQYRDHDARQWLPATVVTL